MTFNIVTLSIMALTTTVFVAFFYYRQKALLQFFQQEEYESARFLRWVWDKKAFDKRTSLALIIVFLATSLVVPSEGAFSYINLALFIAALFWGIYLSRISLANSKKPLVMTMRAKRILWISMIFPILALFAPLPLVPFAFLLLLQLPPLFLVLADALLKPFEAGVKNKFLNEAKEKVRALNPTIIAISGSYGKTSTKHILAHILGASAPTLATPGSVNTEMGVTRIIREQLEKRHKYFIVEMGAYGEGSIAKLCALSPPDIGIITGIGQAHLERFGDVDTIFKAKFELADATHNKQGHCIINATRMPQHLLQQRLAKGSDDFFTLRSGEDDGQADVNLQNITADHNGLSFSLKGIATKKDINIKAPVFGGHQAENISLAIMAAQKLGVPIDTIKAALSNLPQTRHRLELFKPNKGPWVLDDAYNSNPKGFAEALQTLDILTKDKDNGGKAFLITPGMVEMGTDHDKEHYEIGRLAGEKVDVAAIVTPERIESFMKGFKETMKAEAKLEAFSTQDEAQIWVKSMAKKGDVILYENNLPDLFESQIRF